jgi:hypothetical protein
VSARQTVQVISPPTRLGPHRPLRVHVVGNSASFLVEPTHGPRDLGTYGEQLEWLLGEQGVPTVTTHTGTWFGMVHNVLSRWETDIRDRFPDVLVLHYGMAECQSNAVPSWLIRHTGTWYRTSRRGAKAYRRWVAGPLWRSARRLQRWTSTVDRDLTHRLSPRRFETDMHRVIDLVRKECGSLVLLVDLDPVGPRVEHWLPGTTRRAAHYQAILAAIADSYDDAVRLVPAGAQLVDVDTYVPDGLHRTAAGHTLTARLLAEEITRWLNRT